MTETSNEVPGRNEPDPDNIRMRSFQGGAVGLTAPATMHVHYGDWRYADGEGPFANAELPDHNSAGLSGLPQADAGAVPPQWDETHMPKKDPET